MSKDLRFDGKVAVVTGAGGGLGRIYALDLAKRGAKVVVNDLGGSTRGEGKDTSAADKVVAEIKKLGGEAVANYDSVVEGAKIIKTAIDTYGRVDILINNAGILRDVSFLKMSEEDWKLMTDVHLHGAYACTKAAWPHMRKNGYGRVIMVTSAAGLYGNFGQAHYSTVKMGLVGLAKTLSLEGNKSNIMVNVIAPIAGSRMTETVMPPNLIEALKPEYVSPLVQYLVHDSNETTGQIYEVGAGWVSAVRWQRSKGVFFPLNKFSIESVRDKIAEVSNFDNPSYPTSAKDGFEPIMENINNQPAAAAAAAEQPKSKAKPAGKNPNVDVSKALAYVPEPTTITYSERDVMLYALGIGAGADPMDKNDLKFVYENHNEFQTFPTFGVVIPSAALNSAMTTPGLNFNPMMLLHGEQYMEVKSPLPTSGTMTNKAKIENLYDKGSGALLILGVSTFDEKGKELLYNRYSLFIRGLGNFGGEKGPAPPSYDPPAHTPPDVIHREKTLDNQAILYRLSGDYNPLHIDPELAASGGFQQPILHGLCTFGYATRAVIKHFCKNDSSRFKSIKVRFVKHVFPGETLITEMWKVSPTQIVFRVKVAERGDLVLSNAMIELHPLPGEAPAAAPAAAPASTSGAGSGSGFLAESVFQSLEKQASEELVKKVNAIFRFDINKGDKKRTWLLNLKTGKGAITVADEKAKADCVIAISDEDFVSLMSGKLDAQKAFMSGKIKLKGNMMLAQKLQLLQPKKSKL